MPRYIDPHLDPLRAPSRAGHHPHLVPEAPSRVNPQQMYERREQMSAQYRQMPQRMGQAPQPQQNDDVWGKVFVGLGILAAVYAGFKLAQSASDGEVRRNPSEPPMPQPGPAQLVVMPGPVQALPPAQVPAPVVIETPIPTVSEQKKRKQVRKRRTTQDRNDDGTYKTAGTLKRAKTEGKGKK